MGCCLYHSSGILRDWLWSHYDGASARETLLDQISELLSTIHRMDAAAARTQWDMFRRHQLKFKQAANEIRSVLLHGLLQSIAVSSDLQLVLAARTIFPRSGAGMESLNSHGLEQATITPKYQGAELMTDQAQ